MIRYYLELVVIVTSPRHEKITRRRRESGAAARGEKGVGGVGGGVGGVGGGHPTRENRA
jgi:hypothetical protein